jgi:RNA polymerase sigma-70 factor (ECF subfamily)
MIESLTLRVRHGFSFGITGQSAETYQRILHFSPKAGKLLAGKNAGRFSPPGGYDWLESSSGSGTSPTLLGRLRRNPTDEAAWRDFVARYGPRILQWCRNWKIQEADSQDVTQAVLVKLAQQMRSFEYDPAGSFRGWLKTLTQHALSDFVSARKRSGHGSGDSGVWESLHSVEARIELQKQLEAEFDRELLTEAMARIQLRVAANKWKAFQLTAIDGLSGADAAAQLGMKVATVFTAKSKVQKLVQDEIRKLDRAGAN